MSERNRFLKSEELLQKARQLIPGGTQTFSKSAMYYPQGYAPHFISRGEGARVWDVDNNEYIDLMAGLLSLVLGYQDCDVDRALQEQLKAGISFSLASPLESDLAEKIVELIPSAQMTRFMKTGSDATTAALRIARAATGKKHVIVTGYHGWHDWYIGTTPRNKGVPDEVRALSHQAPYNDIDAIEKLFSDYSGDIAALIIEPVYAQEPAAGYLEALRELCDSRACVFIFDEIITGCRVHKGGAQAYYDVVPDLTCMGKALGNGLPISLVTGKSELMKEFEDVFVSGTFNGETLSIAAALAVLEKIERDDVITHLWEMGGRLKYSLTDSISSHGLTDIITLQGLAPMQSLVFSDHENASREAIHTLYIVSMLEQGILTMGALNIMFAHSPEDMDKVSMAFDRSCQLIAEELGQPGLDQRLSAPLIQPVFSVRGK